MKARESRRPLRLQLNRLVMSAFDDVAQVCESQNIILTYDTNRHVHYVLANKEGLTETMVSLLKNAMQLAGKGGEVAVEQKRLRGNRFCDSSDLIKVSIRICGRGVSDGLLQNISARFKQMTESLNQQTPEPSPNRLSACKDFIRQTGGNIWVKSKLGHGLSFNFTLPLLREIRVRRSGSKNSRSSRVRVVQGIEKVDESAVKLPT